MPAKSTGTRIRRIPLADGLAKAMKVRNLIAVPSHLSTDSVACEPVWNGRERGLLFSAPVHGGVMSPRYAIVVNDRNSHNAMVVYRGFGLPPENGIPTLSDYETRLITSTSVTGFYHCAQLVAAHLFAPASEVSR
jgi:hypothetical protein